MDPGDRAATPGGCQNSGGKNPGDIFKGKKLHFLQFFSR